MAEWTRPVAIPAGWTQRRVATRLSAVAAAIPHERGRDPNGRIRLSGGNLSFLHDFLAACAMSCSPADQMPSIRWRFRAPRIKPSPLPNSNRNQPISKACRSPPDPGARAAGLPPTVRKRSPTGVTTPISSPTAELTAFAFRTPPSCRAPRRGRA